jgi:predicted Zn-dependent peptidase
MDMDVEQVVTADGVTVVSQRIPGVRSVAVGAWVTVGSRDEATDEHGCSHFLEHTLFKGTARRTARDVAEQFDAIGGELNAFTTRELTCFHARVLDRDVPLAVDVLGDMLAGANNSARDVDAERLVVLSEIDIHNDTPEDLAGTALVGQVIGDDPLARDALGTAASVAAMPRERIHGFYERWYRPANIVVTAAGNLDHGTLRGLVEEHLGDLGRGGGDRPARTVPTPVTAPSTTVRTRPTEQVHVALGGTGLTLTDAGRAALGVLDTILGSGMSSRLFQAVREDRGLGYATYSWTSSWSDAGMWGVYGGVAPDRAEELVEVLVHEVDRLAATLTEEEVARARGSLQGAVVLGGEDVGSRMSRLGRWVTAGLPVLDTDEVLRRIGRVTLPDVRALAEQLLGGTRHLALVGPVDEAAVPRP